MVFTDHTGREMVRLEKLRLDVLATMKSYSKKQPDNFTPMVEALIERLEVIKVSVVD